MLKKFKKKVLIIGGDSRLGLVLKNNLKKKFNIYETTRRNKKSNNSFYLNFKNIKNFNPKIFFDFVIIVGGITDYKTCNKNFNYAYKINCINIPKISELFIKKGSFLIFISTNTVFKYIKKIPNEFDKPNPGFNYSKLKFIAEKKIFRIAKKNKAIKNFSILRLSKNVNKSTAPFDQWIKFIKKNKSFNAFEDLYFAPILFEDSASLIKKIILTESHGIFHLSGEKDFNYYNFAIKLQKKFKKKNLVSKKNSADLGVKLIYNHHITSLKMNRTTKILKYKPVNIYRVLSYLKGN